MQTNFAYGSTPYLTWRRVMQSPRVAAALAAAITAQPLPAPERRASDADVAARQQIEGDSRDEDGQGEAGAGAEVAEYLVLGSSVGWMVLFAAATYGVRSRSAHAQRHRAAASGPRSYLNTWCRNMDRRNFNNYSVMKGVKRLHCLELIMHQTYWNYI